MIFFDAGCGFCSAAAARTRRLLARRGFRLMPLQAPEARAMTGASHEALMREAHLLTSHTPPRVLRGVDAILYVAGAIRCAAPLRWAARVPGVMPVLRAGYRWFAGRRYGLSAACGLRNPNPVAASGTTSSRAGLGDRGISGSQATLDPEIPQVASTPLGMTAAAPASRNAPRRARESCATRDDDHAGRWAPPAAWLAMALLAGPYVPAWAWMWLIAFAMYFGCKWATWWPYRFAASATRGMAYLLTYSGMDAKAFLTAPPPAAPGRREYAEGLLNIAAGVASMFLVARHFHPERPLLSGWIAMCGMALTIHFGVLHLIALAWRRGGVAAEPLMKRPTRSRSLAEFWGRRWNTGFRTLSHELMFDPLRTRVGATAALAATFLASGVIHDLVISLPARGGYGMPTLYFLIQLAGLLLERTRFVRTRFVRTRLARRPLLGWLYTALFTLAPMPLLFHERFVHNVLLPFLNTIGGLS